MIQIITDSTSDYPKTMWARKGIEVVPLNVDFGDHVYKDRLELDPDAFYEKLVQSKSLPKTSQPSPGEFLAAYEKYPEDDLLVIPMSKGLSGTYQSALLAKEMSERENIYVVDTDFTSQGLQWLVDEAIRLKEEGKSAPEIKADLEDLKNHIRLIAVVDTLDYLYKGGRISKATMMAGNFIKIHPIIGLQEGKIAMFSKARGKKSVAKEIMKLMDANEIDPSAVYFGYSGTYDEQEMRDFMQPFIDTYHFTDLSISQIGSLVGTHTGPGLKCIVYRFK